MYECVAPKAGQLHIRTNARFKAPRLAFRPTPAGRVPSWPGAETARPGVAAPARPLDSPFHLGVALVGLGDMARLGGDAPAAGERYREALRLFGAAGERQAVAVCLRFLGWFAWATGRPERAARLYGAGEALWPGAAAADGDEEEARLHAGVHAGLAERLGPDAYVAARRAGARLTLEAAVAEGLSAQQA